MTPEFTAIYEQEFTAVWRFLRRLGVAEAAVDDLCHDTFLLAWKRFDAFDRNRPARPWLFGIAFRLASDFRSLKRHSTEAADDEAVLSAADPTAAGPLERLEARQASDLVQAALETLSLDLRTVFVLHELEERPIPEVAELMQTPVPTAYARLRTARQRFASAVQRQSRAGGLS